MTHPVIGGLGERSALAEALFWAERVGQEVYDGSVQLAERDANCGWTRVCTWGNGVTQTEVSVSEWASLWTGLGPVPGWPPDGAEGERWAFHLPRLASQRLLALRLLGRRVVRLPPPAGNALKAAFLRSLRLSELTDREVLRVQFYTELRAASAERQLGRTDLTRSHLALAVQLPAPAQQRLERHGRRPKFTHILPNTASLAVYGLVTGAPAADFEFGISFIPGFDRDHERTPVPIGGTFDSTDPGGTRGAVASNLSDFLPHGRLRVHWQSKAGVNAVKAASISAILIVTLLT